jgi:hypothetical protein
MAADTYGATHRECIAIRASAPAPLRYTREKGGGNLPGIASRIAPDGLTVVPCWGSDAADGWNGVTDAPWNSEEPDGSD